MVVGFAGHHRQKSMFLCGEYETRRAARPAWLVKEGESRPAVHFAPQLAPCSTSHRHYPAAS